MRASRVGRLRTRRRCVTSGLGIAVYCAVVGTTFGAAPGPEANDPDVARCAQVAAMRLARDGFDRATVAGSNAGRADACILRWEEPSAGTIRSAWRR